MKKLNSVEMREKQSNLIKRCQEIVDLCKTEVREMTEEEEKEYNDAKAEIEQLKADLDALKKRLEEYEVPSLEEEEEDPQAAAEEENQEENGCGEEDQDTEKKENRKMTKKTKKFSLCKELRKAYESGKPLNLNEVRAYTVDSEGEDVVQTDLFDIWGPLRAKNVLIQAGARYYEGVKNNVQIPLMGATSVAWAGETDAASDGSGVFSSKVLTPKRLTAKVPVSLELLAQDSIGIEQAIRNDIIDAVNAKLEATLLSADAGTTKKPQGIFYVPDGGTALTEIASFADLTAFEAGVEAANVYGDCKYIMSPAAKGVFRGMDKGENGDGKVMQAGAIDGTEVLSTSHVKDQNVAYGDWKNVVIATWDAVQLDVVRDVASLANGQVTIVVNAYCDGALVRDEAIARGTTDVD